MNGSSKPQPLVWLRIGGALLFALLYLYPIMGFVLSLQALGCLLYSLIFDDDERMLELASCLHIHTEVGLKGIRYFDSLRDIEKSTPAPDSSMEGCEHMITIWNDAHKV